jgi:radical SAM protein with 4Fe4S-binding SPASM domain
MTRPACAFDLPWRIHWQLPPGGDEAVAAAVREAAPLAFAVEAEREADLDCLGLPWPGAAVTWVWTGWAGGRAPAPGTAIGPAPLPAGIARVEFPVEGAEQAKQAIAGFPRDGFPVGAIPALRFVPRSPAFAGLPDLLCLARAAGWGATLPALPGEGALPPAEARARADFSPAGRERMRADAAAFPPGALVVHDFFLSRLLGLPAAEVAGCEGGDALAFVDRKGRVFPCRSLLIPLGELPGDSFFDLWNSPARHALREEISRVPAPCAACSDLPSCRGGCRGLAWHVAGGFADPDPSCPGPTPRPKGARR